MCCLGLWTRRRRRALALSIPESGHSPPRVDSGPPNLCAAPAHIISSLNTQQAIAEGEQLSWLSEKRLLLQRLESLQRAVARLELEKTELKQLNAELRRTLEQVKEAFAASAQPCGPLECNTDSTLESSACFLPSPAFPRGHTRLYFLSLLAPRCLHKCNSLRYHPSCPRVPRHTHLTPLCQELFPLALSLPQPTWRAFCPQRSLGPLTVSEQTSPCRDVQRSFCSLFGGRFL